MKMLKNNILIAPKTKEQLGHIVLPDSVEDSWLRGEVIGKGEEVSELIKVGDIVLFPPGPPHLNGQYPTVGNEGHIIIHEMYIWAVED